MKGIFGKEHNQDAGLLVLRLGLGFILFYHGFVKVFSIQFPGIADLATMEMFQGYLMQLQIPAPELMGWVVGLVELLGGIAIIVGAFTCIAAWLVVIQFTVILLWVKQLSFPFAEVDLLIFVSALMLAFSGAGAYSLDEKYKLEQRFSGIRKK